MWMASKGTRLFWRLRTFPPAPNSQRLCRYLPTARLPRCERSAVPDMLTAHKTIRTTNPTRDPATKSGVDDGTRTRDGRNHNPGLYQLSYVHHRRTPDLGWRARQESNLQPPA